MASGRHPVVYAVVLTSIFVLLWSCEDQWYPNRRALAQKARIPYTAQRPSARGGHGNGGGLGQSVCGINASSPVLERESSPRLYVYVINLRGRPERYSRLRQRLRNLRPLCSAQQERGSGWLQIERIEASDGSEAGRLYNPGFQLSLGGVIWWTIPHWALFRRVRKYWTRDVTIGEKGLYLSHMRALRRISENSHLLSQVSKGSSGVLHLVLEDDATFRTDIHVVEQIFSLQSRLRDAVGAWDVINLGPSFPEGRGASPSAAWIHAVREGPTAGILAKSYLWSSHALLVSPTAAGTILRIDREQQNIIPFDEFLPALAWTHPRKPLSALYLPKSAPLQYYGVRIPLVTQLNDGVHDTERGAI